GEQVPTPQGSPAEAILVVAELTEAEAAAVEDRPDVEAVVPDVRLRMAPAVASSSRAAAVPWGLDRIDQRSRSLDGVYRTPTTGAGTVVAVVDGGISYGHAEFAGRILTEDDWDFVGRDVDDPDDGDASAAECTSGAGRGHGTHVAATAAGATLGVAPGASLLPLRVFDCEGYATFADLYSAFHHALALSRELDQRMVVNYSGGVYTDELDDDGLEAARLIEEKVAELVAAGVPVVTAAGNADVDSCLSSPGRLPEVINVAASTSADRRAEFSDRGRCADLFAPGVGIRSAWVGSKTATTVLDGTSMAAPHVTGVVARLLQRSPRATSAQVRRVLTDQATWDVVADSAGTPNRLLYADLRLAPPSAPTSVALRTDHARQSVVLSWKAPTRYNGPTITGYRVTRSGTDSRGTGPESVLVARTELAKTFRYLVPGRSYTFTVAAVNGAGTGPAATTKVTVLKPPGKPITPVLRSGSTTDSPVSVTVDWDRPSGSSLTSYRVTVRRTSDGATKTVTVPASSSTWVKVTGLSRGKTYTATVRAVNAAGQGPLSSTSPSATAR
ncbi:S8 family serine peptidase, partial [Desertihabitans aurantiacus]|uniref:S8 family serine peptidase n=1 Tax=Desertihabitans aurantiacus TaxID=2282477 RepID=UPI000DF85208